MTIQKPKKKKNSPETDDEFVVRWQNPALQADLVVEKLRTLNPKLSAIELGELSIPGMFPLHQWLTLREGLYGQCNLGIAATKCCRPS